MPQQLASIAEVLGPLLQQQGIMQGANINLGQLQQGLGAGLAQQGLMQVNAASLSGVSCDYSGGEGISKEGACWPINMAQLQQWLGAGLAQQGLLVIPVRPSVNTWAFYLQ